VKQSASPERTAEGIRIYRPEDFDGMRAAGRLAAETLDMIARMSRRASRRASWTS
jgi:methionyl aminopeptidase